MNDSQTIPLHGPGSVRHVEKRRTGTCRFADRIAEISLETYRSYVPQTFRAGERQTCVAAILAHFQSDGHLQVVGLGVGTKFLTEKMLHAQESNDLEAVEKHKGDINNRTGYGVRVRDCHSEVLARRAFRRQLCLEIRNLLRDSDTSDSNVYYRPVLCYTDDGQSFDLEPGVTLHFYSSSAPCGNATLKKFTKMEREKYNDRLGADEWPEANHDPIPGHALRQGQFALLVKRDPKMSSDAGARSESDKDSQSNTTTPPKGEVWPFDETDDWCPPGTSIVPFRKGSLHTCSDKLCRWNCLGLQGSLLASMLARPLFMSTMTVGRKFTACICRRAVCCRAKGFGEEESRETRNKDDYGINITGAAGIYSLHHPVVMGTGVYMDSGGVIDMTDSHRRRQDARFDSTPAWAWWPAKGDNHGNAIMAECIDTATGLACKYSNREGSSDACNDCSSISMVSTAQLVLLFLELSNGRRPTTLAELRALKRLVSPEYETAKDTLLSRHKVFRQWRRREYDI